MPYTINRHLTATANYTPNLTLADVAWAVFDTWNPSDFNNENLIANAVKNIALIACANEAKFLADIDPELRRKIDLLIAHAMATQHVLDREITRDIIKAKYETDDEFPRSLPRCSPMSGAFS